mmetsp:Transcript_20690/g.49711  ORF Transcript_20690/g.49711 Transcript_20690/m.49711 type:complete len:245 (-) Transcript_20690:160-894(-)
MRRGARSLPDRYRHRHRRRRGSCTRRRNRRRPRPWPVRRHRPPGRRRRRHRCRCRRVDPCPARRSYWHSSRARDFLRSRRGSRSWTYVGSRFPSSSCHFQNCCWRLESLHLSLRPPRPRCSPCHPPHHPFPFPSFLRRRCPPPSYSASSPSRRVLRWPPRAPRSGCRRRRQRRPSFPSRCQCQCHDVAVRRTDPADLPRVAWSGWRPVRERRRRPFPSHLLLPSNLPLLTLLTLLLLLRRCRGP